MEYVIVADKVGSDDAMELPVEKDGTVLLSTVQAQFPTAIGLKFRSSSGAWRGIRVEDNVLDAPHEGWGMNIYIITESKALKRESMDSISDGNGIASKARKTNLLEDIIVLGLPYTTTGEELEKYFTDNCGKLAFHEIKYDRATKKSRGFGFIRFKTEEGAEEALNNAHSIQGRKLEVRMSKREENFNPMNNRPSSNNWNPYTNNMGNNLMATNGQQYGQRYGQPENPMKLFVGRLPGGTTNDEVNQYFSQFGVLCDCFVPNPFRGFGFVTFSYQEDATRVLNMNHMLQGATLHVTPAEPKEGQKQKESHQENNGNYTWDPSNRSGYSTIPPQASKLPSQNAFVGGPPAQKDVASELKDLLMTLISKS